MLYDTDTDRHSGALRRTCTSCSPAPSSWLASWMVRAGIGLLAVSVSGSMQASRISPVPMWSPCRAFCQFWRRS